MTDNKLWQGSSDIFTDYEGTVVDGAFENGQYGTQIKLTFDEIDGREDPVFEYYSVPDSWTTTDGGVTIERVDGKDARVAPLKKSNQWMRFVLAAAGLVSDPIAEFGEDAPIRATSWIGTRWRMEAVEGKTYTDRDTNEKKKAKDKNYPVEYLGKDKVDTGNNGSGKVDDLSVLTDLRDPLLQQEIVEAAARMGYSEWFQYSYQVIQKSGVPMNELADLLAAMGQPKLYESLGGKG